MIFRMNSWREDDCNSSYTQEEISTFLKGAISVQIIQRERNYDSDMMDFYAFFPDDENSTTEQEKTDNRTECACKFGRKAEHFFRQL